MIDKILTQEDVAKLLSDPSTDTRVETVTKIADGFNAGAMSDAECQLAEIFSCHGQGRRGSRS
jgi:hypothetical protein